MTTTLNQPSATSVALCHILIDNYEELSNGVNAKLLNAAAHIIYEDMEQAGGVVRQYQGGKYLVVLDIAGLDDLCAHKFPILDHVRDLTSAFNNATTTFSIAVGLGSSVRESSRYAQQALELVLGRGGDQAVIKRGNEFQYYGGKHQPGERYSRVKSRTFARALGHLMLQYDQIFLMGHAMADFDSMGSALGVACCAKALNKQVFIVVESQNNLIQYLLDDLCAQNDWKDILLTPEEAINRCTSSSLCIVVDTQRANSTAAPPLLKKAGAIVVIDHHRRGVDSIEQTALQHILVSASSCCELVCEIIEYFEPEVLFSPLVGSALLSGIVVDSKHFTVNTGARTFEAAAFLRHKGADINYVKLLFEDDHQSYLQRSEIVKNASPIAPGILLAINQNNSFNSALAASEAADVLITFRGIRAAFVLTETNNDISVSARSNSTVNVQLIMEKIGGGGHLNVAGAHFSNNTIQEVSTLVEQAVKQYLEN